MFVVDGLILVHYGTEVSNFGAASPSFLRLNQTPPFDAPVSCFPHLKPISKGSKGRCIALGMPSRLDDK